ncbi:hypothetical protein COCON_G00026860 [Conger conger]|uniref:Envoplakin n=1 Tax=Conger conger TaxID=82655 RepID=A0A9Q1DY05_CONCO|nr:envoplakin a [Conger conger]KAJ8283836.1 hypothetical protein COCON_G00026860 [Conger conger]
MFKKKDGGLLKVSGKISKSQVNDLALLIARMQKNADVVEKDVLRAEELLAVDAENLRKDLPLKHQKENADRLAEAEGLLKDLFLDVDKAKKLKHPQGSEIESDVSHLHDRWFKDCGFYREVYEQIKEVELAPRIDWAQVLNQKQRQVNAEEYGPSMSDLEKQIASHNILHKEIEAYKNQLDVSSTGSKEEFAAIQKQYNNLLDNSKWRHQYLSSLYDYMQGCNKELAYLNEEQKKIQSQDWSDRMVDPPDVRRQYEHFKNNSLLSHESEVNKLQDGGDRLIEMKHPASDTIQMHRDALRTEWQEFLNLCICQESHLENVEEYKKFQLDADTLSENLGKLNSSLDPKAQTNKTHTEILLQLEGEERAMQRNEQDLADLKTRSTSITPLKLRRSQLNKPVSVESLCDWSTKKASVTRGEKLLLKSNSDNENWNLQASNGTAKTMPGVCFVIPPPDPEAINKVDRLTADLSDLKKKRAALQASLKNHTPEVTRSLKSAPVTRAAMDPKSAELATKLDQLDDDLDKAQQDILSLMRAPLDRTDPAADLANRLKEQEKAALALKRLEQEKAAAEKEMEPLLSQQSSGTVSSALPLKLNDAKNKQDSIAGLADLFSKKAKASLDLENQIRKVDGFVSGYEKKLAADTTIPDTPNAIQARTQDLQAMRDDVASKQGEMQKLSEDLEATEQLCSSLQKGYQEYCPDIRRQETEVKQLKNRYTNVNNQLQKRENVLQEAGNKNQALQSTSQSLNSFLNNLPDNKISPTDDLSQINTKQNSQKRVVEDIGRKGDDLDRAVELSNDLQSALNEYETNSEKYRSTLSDRVKTGPELNQPSLADAVQKQEKALVNRYAEVSAENEQLLNQMDFAKNLISQKDEKISHVAVQQQMQLQSQQRVEDETEDLKKELTEEITRRTHAESDLENFRLRFMSLKSRRGVERVEEKEVLQYYRDPKLESDLESLRNQIHSETLKRSSTHSEIEMTNEKIISLETELQNIKPKLVTKEVTEIERDPQLDVEAARLRDEIRNLKDEVRIRESETVQMKTEVHILEQKRPTIKEKLVKKEVIKFEKNPETLRAVTTLEAEIGDEGLRSKSLNDEIFQTRSQINTLERVIPTIQPRIIVKEVKKVEQDHELISESKKLQLSLEEERLENNSLINDLTSLRHRYGQVEQMKPKVEVKEIINEIYRVDPETEAELVRLRKELKESSRHRSELEREITLLMTDLNTLRSQKPKVEMKEVVQEVVKEEKSPEIIREMQRLNEQLYRLQTTYDTTLDQLNLLRRERDQWKAEKSKVETKLLTREVIKYENDPLLEKEAERFRREVREETQRRRTIEETVFDLQNKSILLERQKPEEKVVIQEVVRLEKDPRQILEHEKLSKNLDDEMKSRRNLELEVQQLRAQVLEKERFLKQSDERQKKIQVEMELRQITTRIRELENAPPPLEEKIVVEEVMKVERDPKLEKMTNGLRIDMDKESSDIIRLERDIRNLTHKLEILQRDKSVEKTVYKEVIRVEKDQAVEAERTHLREQMSQARNARRDIEDEIQRLTEKLNRSQTTKTSKSMEETTLIHNRDTLLREKDSLSRELRTVESEKQDISISYQQHTRLMSERSQMNRQKSLKMDSDVQRLEREILDEKDNIHKRENTIRELLNSLKKEDSSETRTRETNVSTRITILDPETGKDMSPYDAYVEGLIDRNQYIHLQELECNWEEVTTMGPDGEISVLQDRKSGKQYSINNALKDGRLTQYDLQNYKDGKIPISEFALLVAGEKSKKPSTYMSPNLSYSSRSPSSTSSTSNTFSLSHSDEHFPIAGIFDTTSQSRMSVRSAMTRKLIDVSTGQKLLEAQAATGGIVDISNKDRYSVHKAAERGLIDSTHLQRLINAQKAFTGVEDPMTRERLSVGEAVQKDWMPKENAMRYMEAQFLTGGLVDPRRSGRLTIADAAKSKMINTDMARELQEDSNYAKELVDPITKEKINYKQAMARCQKDPVSGLLLLPAASTELSHRSSLYSY